MPLIHLTTVIHAPPSRVFDLSRSITLHKRSMEHRQEQAIKGRTSGLIEFDETVTWRAKHLRKMRELSVRVTAMQKHTYFCDEMEKGDFAYMKHEHHFREIENGTVMMDIFEFAAPYSIFGKWFEKIYLKRYMTRLLQQRNKIIKEYAESEKWRVILD
ncbi:SRPBCC family protein [Chitinophaga sp. XS-30]|uniref:SRPBCC family protein n=1 Tax=Chitinophaga sp. XS-30 TaxID=2604421 RepID=UPI0011DCA5A1|nr:SRPBCC family protein [Chitinophaga sp. XS-30]QEH40091.1 SRPBCC family protein [Chitinophaga sp. XS-30]